MNKKHVIENLNKVNRNNIFKIYNENLINIQLRKISQKIKPNLLKTIGEIFTLKAPEIEKPLSANFKSDFFHREKAQPSFNPKEIQAFFCKEFFPKNPKVEKKSIEKIIFSSAPSLTKSTLLKQNRLSFSSPHKKINARLLKANEKTNALVTKADSPNFLTFKDQQIKQTFERIEEKTVPSSLPSAERKRGSVHSQTPLLSGLNKNMNPKKSVSFDAHVKNKKERPGANLAFVNEKTFFMPSALHKSKGKAEKLLSSNMPILFPKPERDALMAILKDIQHKVSGKKKSHAPIQQATKYVAPAGYRLETALRQTIR